MIRFREVSFRYATAEQWVIRRVNFDVSPGSFCLVCGPSGSGKSTLLRLINGLVPHFSGGIVEGEIQVNGINPIQVGPAAMSRLVGFVFQDPETQFILDNVEDEIAFNLENAAIPPQQITQHLEETLHALGILHLRRRRLESLSGGEKQKVAIATVLSLAPSILVLDEPTSQLDGQSAEEILSLIQRLARQQKLTIVVAEHRLDRLLHFANQLIYLSGIGEPIRADEPQQVLPHMATVPPVVELGKRFGVRPLPLSISEGQQMVRKLGLERLNHRTSPVGKKQMDSAAGPAILSVEKVSVSFGKTQALSEVTLQLFASQITCLMGANGAGKTTLLRAILGLVPLTQGRIWLQAKEITTTPSWKRARWIGYLPQDPNALLFSETVLEELLLTLRNHGLPQERSTAERILEGLGLSKHALRYPRDLSVGERQRVALGAILITQPQVLLLDEPTRGLDEEAKAKLGDLVRSFRAKGMAILVVTHDVEFMLTLADRLCILDAGRLIDDGAPPTVLRRNQIPPAQLLQLFPDQEFCSVEEVLSTIAEAWSHTLDKSGRPALLAFHSDGNRPHRPESPPEVR